LRYALGVQRFIKLSPTINSPIRRRAGGAAVWVVVALVLGALALILVMAQSHDNGSAGSPGSSNSTTAPLNRELAQTKLDGLEAQLLQAMENKREVGSIVAEARKFVAAYTTFVSGHMHLAKALLYNHQPLEAYDQLNVALEMDPRQPAVRDFAGTLAIMLDRPGEAQKHYSQAVGLEPTNGLYRLRLAQAHLKQNHFDPARQILLEALRIDSSLHEAHYTLCDLYARQNKIVLAITQIQHAIRICPQDYKHRTVYSRKFSALLRRDHQPGEALRLLEELPAAKRLEPEVMDDMAVCWAMMNQPQHAAENYEAALTIFPDQPTFAARAAHWYLKANDPEAARRMIYRLRQINPVAPEIAELKKQITQ
jgi:Tfp pilus assembly protein PilF